MKDERKQAAVLSSPGSVSFPRRLGEDQGEGIGEPTCPRFGNIEKTCLKMLLFWTYHFSWPRSRSKSFGFRKIQPKSMENHGPDMIECSDALRLGQTLNR